MENEQEVIPETLNQDAETGVTAETSETTSVVDEEVTAKLKKAEEYAQNQKIRAEKAEQALKALKTTPSEKVTPKTSKYSLEEIDEISALSSIPREDRAEVVEYAERKGIKPSEALNAPLIKTFLREAEEQRKSALASNTGTVKRGSSQSTDESILEKYSNGNLPEDSKEMDRLAEARMNQKLKNRNLKS